MFTSDDTSIYQIRFVCIIYCKNNCSCDSFPGEAIGVQIEGAAPAAAPVTETTAEVCILSCNQIFIIEIYSILLNENTLLVLGKMKILYLEDAYYYMQEKACKSALFNFLIFLFFKSKVTATIGVFI
jgi:hypothetical protein